MIKVNIKNKKVEVNNSLLESELKQNIPIDLFGERTITKKVFTIILKNLEKRLEAPLPLDKTFVHEAIDELKRLKSMYNEK